MSRRGAFLGVLALALAYVVWTAWVLRVPADASHTFPDGVLYRFQAKAIAAGHLVAPAPPVPESFRFLPWLRIERGHWVGASYPGFSLALAPGELLHVEWLVNPILSGLLLLATFALGRRAGGDAVGVGAALLLACAPIQLRLTTTYLTHVFAALLLATTALLLTSRSDRPGLRGVLSGLCLGWALASPRAYSVVWVAGALALGLLPFARGSHRRPALLAGLATGLLPWLAFVAYWNHTITGSAFTSPYALWWRQDFQIGFVDLPHSRAIGGGRVVDRFTPEVAWIATRRLLAMVPGALLPWPSAIATPTAVAAAVAAIVLRRRAVVWIGPFLALVAGYFIYPGILGPAAWLLGPRFYYEAFPALAVLLAMPLAWLWRGGRVGRIVSGGTLALVAGAFLVGAAPDHVRAVRAAHSNPLTDSTRILERFLASLPRERRLVFVDVSTYQLASAAVVGNPDLSGDSVVAIYREPELNARLAAHFPDRTLWLFRWDGAAAAPRLAPYDPATDQEGPPDRFPYDRRRLGGSRRAAGRDPPGNLGPPEAAPAGKATAE
ncbi:MAG: hypothetical protein R3B81_19320 [bacterium]